MTSELSPLSNARTVDLTRAIIHNTLPIYVAKMAAILTAVTDTFIATRVGTIDLAAVGIASGVSVCVMLSLADVTQGITPIAAHHHGAKRTEALSGVFQQGIWLTLLLSVAGVLMLFFPNWILHLSSMSPEVEARTRAYLMVEAWSMPGMLVYRACGGMLNAIGKPKMLTVFGIINTIGHFLLAPALAFGWLGFAPLGAVGCAASSAIIGSSLAMLSLAYLAKSSVSRSLHLLSHWQAPHIKEMGTILRIGVPIGMSAFVEISSFSLIGLLAAPLGAVAVGGYRILSNFSAVTYMIPLSISIATLAFVGQAAGARDAALVRKTVRVGMMLAVGASVVVGTFFWMLHKPIIRAYTPDVAVQAAAIPLVFLIALYQFFDAIQTMSAQVLRGLKITAMPMLLHIISFWGVGMAGGWWLAYHGIASLNIPPQGMGGFWWGVTLATVVASVLFGALLRYSLKRL